jgi:DNA-binding transcriptional ArsR family regulator
MDNYNPALDPVFAALSDGTRRDVLRRLSNGPASVSELAAPLRMALPSLMKHLSVLERAGVVATRKRGRTRTCWLRPAALLGAESWLAGLREPGQGFDPPR